MTSATASSSPIVGDSARPARIEGTRDRLLRAAARILSERGYAEARLGEWGRTVSQKVAPAAESISALESAFGNKCP